MLSVVMLRFLPLASLSDASVLLHDTVGIPAVPSR